MSPQLVKKFPTFYESAMSITAVRHLSIPTAKLIHSMNSLTLAFRCNLSTFYFCLSLHRNLFPWELPAKILYEFLCYRICIVVHGGTVGWDIALQDGRSRVRYLKGPLGCFLIQSFQPHYGPGADSVSNRYKPGIPTGGQRRPAPRSDNLTTVICRLARNSGCFKLLEPLVPLQG